MTHDCAALTLLMAIAAIPHSVAAAPRYVSPYGQSLTSTASTSAQPRVDYLGRVATQ